MSKVQARSNKQAESASVAVVGAGIIGINCALALQSRGFNVTLLDKQGIGEGCSKGNAGHFATEQVFPLAQASMLPQLPKMLLSSTGPVAIAPSQLFGAMPWFIKFLLSMRPKASRHISKALKSLNLNAIDYYRPWLQAAGCEDLLKSNGALLVFEQTPLDTIKTTRQQFINEGVAVELLNREQTLALEPDLHDNIQYALFFPEVAHTIEPHQLCFKLTELANQRGMQYLKADVEKITQTGNQVTVTTNGQAHHFDKLVLATGAWSKALIKQLGYTLPLVAERGYHAELENHVSLTRPVTSAERKFIMTPMANGLRLAGTVEYAPLDKPANYSQAASLIHHAKSIVKQLPKERENNSRWMGPRPSLPDSLPVICQAPNHDHIYFAVGHHHLGLTQGAITGKLIGQLIQGQATDIDISPFDIRRFN